MNSNEKELSLEHQEGHVLHGSNGDRQEAAISTRIGIPMEAALLVTIDQIQTPEFKKRLMDTIDETHQHLIELNQKVMERDEARKDRQSEAYIERQNKGQWMSFVLSVLALVVFICMFYCGASASQLCAIGIFLLGPAGVVVISKLIKSSPPNKD